MTVNANQLSQTSEFLGIASFNMHGLRNDLGILSELCLDHRFNIIAVQEHWLHRSTLNTFNVVKMNLIISLYPVWIMHPPVVY